MLQYLIKICLGFRSKSFLALLKIVLCCFPVLDIAKADIIDDLEDPEEEGSGREIKTEPKSLPDKEPQSTPIPLPQSKKQKPSGARKAPASDAQRKKLPIHLKSDGEAIYSKNGGVVHLVKNVRISQGNLFFRADEAKAYFVEIAGENVVEKVEIYGNVNVAKYSKKTSENVKASGKRALYLNSVGVVTLIGNARLWQGGHLIKGKQITYELSTGIVKVDRAEGVVQPGEKKK